jgi:hypothetical protein
MNLCRVALEHYGIGALYYAALEKSPKEAQKTTAAQYKVSAEAYFGALSMYEQHLLSIERDDEIHQELKSIQTSRHSVELLLKYL